MIHGKGDLLKFAHLLSVSIIQMLSSNGIVREKNIEPSFMIDLAEKLRGDDMQEVTAGHCLAAVLCFKFLVNELSANVDVVSNLCKLIFSLGNSKNIKVFIAILISLLRIDPSRKIVLSASIIGFFGANIMSSNLSFIFNDVELPSMLFVFLVRLADFSENPNEIMDRLTLSFDSMIALHSLKLLETRVAIQFRRGDPNGAVNFLFDGLNCINMSSDEKSQYSIDAERKTIAGLVVHSKLTNLNCGEIDSVAGKFYQHLISLPNLKIPAEILCSALSYLKDESHVCRIISLMHTRSTEDLVKILSNIKAVVDAALKFGLYMRFDSTLFQLLSKYNDDASQYSLCAFIACFLEPVSFVSMNFDEKHIFGQFRETVPMCAFTLFLMMHGEDPTINNILESIKISEEYQTKVIEDILGSLLNHEISARFRFTLLKIGIFVVSKIAANNKYKSGKDAEVICALVDSIARDIRSGKIYAEDIDLIITEDISLSLTFRRTKSTKNSKSDCCEAPASNITPCD